MRSLTIALLTAGILLASAGSAFAHAEIKTLSPKPGAKASTSITRVTATFEEAIVSGSLKITKSGDKVSVGKAKFIHEKAGLRAKLKSGLGSGTYKAHMKWLADDGHLEHKTWSFTLR